MPSKSLQAASIFLTLTSFLAGTAIAWGAADVAPRSQESGSATAGSGAAECLTVEAAGPRIQEMLSLAFTAYLDETFIGSDPCVDQEIRPCFEMALDILPKLEGRWKLAWGPYVSKLHDVIYSDNLMFAVETGDGSVSRLAIVIRGTNYVSLSDWLVEDFEIHEMVEWTPEALASCDARVPRKGDRAKPMIAEGTCKGLRALLELPPQVASKCKVEKPEGEEPIGPFVRKWLEAHRETEREIYVTGHSLGGTLTPVLALWLKEQLADLDQPYTRDVDVRAYSFAGLMPGNQTYATRVETTLGRSQVHRIHNPLDGAPLFWSLDLKKVVSELYLPAIKPNVLEDLLLDHWQHQISGDHDYAQVRPDAPPLCRSALVSEEPTFLKQFFWQHHYGYLYGLDMLEWDDEVCQPCAKSLARNFCNEVDTGKGR